MRGGGEVQRRGEEEEVGRRGRTGSLYVPVQLMIVLRFWWLWMAAGSVLLGGLVRLESGEKVKRDAARGLCTHNAW